MPISEVGLASGAFSVTNPLGMRSKLGARVAILLAGLMACGSFSPGKGAPLDAGSIFSSMQATSQSYLRFYNAGLVAGTVTVALRDSATGQTLGRWTSPSIPAGSQQQYFIGTIESGAGIGASARPSYYAITVDSGMTGSYQHVLYRPAEGTLTNLSTCAAGTTADSVRLLAVHSGLIAALGFPSTIAVTNTGGNSASATLGVYDARNGARLGTYLTPAIPVGGQILLTMTAIEAAINLTPSNGMLQYVVRTEGTFPGFLQHLVDNQKVGVITDMTTTCRLQPTLHIATISPAEGPISGGTEVTLTGGGFDGAVVTFDGTSVTLTESSANELRFRTPSRENGYAVVAIRKDGQAAYSRYLFKPPGLNDIAVGAITTVAGIGSYRGDYGPALSAQIIPNNVAIDSSGNVYAAEANFNTVSKFGTDGLLIPVAGNGSFCTNRPPCGDGNDATKATIAFPRGISVDAANGLYIADQDHRIRRVNLATGVITTIAGTGQSGFSGDGGPATNARIGKPTYVTVLGSNVFFIDFLNKRIRRIDGSGTISTIAGNGATGYTGDGGAAVEASFAINESDFGALAIGPDGHLYFADTHNYAIRKVNLTTGVISTVIADTHNAGALVGGMAIDSSGNIYYAGSAIVKSSPAGAILKVYGGSATGYRADGTAVDDAVFNLINGLVLEPNGNLIYSEERPGVVRRLNFATGKLETIAGDPMGSFGESGSALGAALFANAMGEIGFTSNGEMIIADGRVRRLRGDGTLTTIAGRFLNPVNVVPGARVPAADAPIAAIAMAIDDRDEIDVLEPNFAIFHIDRDSMASLTMPSECGYSGDNGAANVARKCQSWGLTRDGNRNLIIADTNNNRIRRVDALNGTVTTIAGTGAVNGTERYGLGTTCGDGGPATSACLNTPYGVAFDSSGSLYVTEFWANRIRKIDGAGAISTFVRPLGANSTVGSIGLRFDRAGNLYTNAYDRLLRIDRNGTITTVAGLPGNIGFSGDGGSALQAKINRGDGGLAAGIAIDSDDNLYFVDAGNRRIRAIRGGARLN